MSDIHILKIPGRYDHIKQVCEFMAAGAQQAGLDDDAIFKVELACDEACTNIIEHAYGEEGVGDINATWEATPRSFTITLHDNGRGFDPDGVEDPAITKLEAEPKPDELKVGGLGIHFMRNLMDEVRYQFDEKHGNTLTMVKYIEPSPLPKQPSIWQEQVAADIWLVGVRGRLDQSLIPQLDDMLTSLINNGRFQLMIDFSNVSYINSGGLRCLVSAWRKARAEKGDVVLFGLNNRLLEVFTMVGFDNVFPIYSTRLEAQTAMQM